MNSTRAFIPRLLSSTPRAFTSTTTTPLLRLRPLSYHARRTFQSSSNKAATLLPITAHGPPPKPPTPTLSPVSELRRRQRVSGGSKKFWKEVNLVETKDGYTINLDTRPIKTPENRIVLIPLGKSLLAFTIGLEWANLNSPKDALKSHRIPLTQMASRAIDLAAAEEKGDIVMREDIVQSLIRYLDTDTVLCWAPTTPTNLREPGRPTLRELQIEATTPLLQYLTTRVWPGLEVLPVDGDRGILGTGQPRRTKETLMSWMRQLDVWKLIGLERVVYATKSFVIGAKMVAEWSEGGDEGWGISEACDAASIEVRYQTRQWGEVEDTHDVEKEDMARQIGAGLILICEHASGESEQD